MDAREHERWWTERGDRELRELLLREWDPIGIARIADSQLDEYEHYAGQLVRRLRAGASEEEVAAVLESFRADMGLEPSDELPLGPARAIRDWYRRSTVSEPPGT
ncbi:MAG: hypothetical protein QOF55_2420 [Thermoleophilaceae bacterium]|jgi:hypothetical protein|nr:hypothetical protein [Thermoleophilaceae bacterium]